MENAPLRASSFIVGGIFISVWLYVLLFVRPSEGIHVGTWAFWGLVGFAIAGGTYAAKVANERVRIVVWVALGIAIGLLGLAAIDRQVGEAFAALFTFVGGGLIAVALPAPTGARAMPRENADG